MPLYDYVVMLKSAISKRQIVDTLKEVASKVQENKGVILDVQSFGRLRLAYEIKKRDGWHKEGQLMQMTIMAPPSFGKDVQYLNKDDRILRQLIIKERRAPRYIRSSA